MSNLEDEFATALISFIEQMKLCSKTKQCLIDKENLQFLNDTLNESTVQSAQLIKEHFNDDEVLVYFNTIGLLEELLGNPVINISTNKSLKDLLNQFLEVTKMILTEYSELCKKFA